MHVCMEKEWMVLLQQQNQLLEEFDSYGNRCLYDTVVKGLPEFFKWYDVRFHPQDTVLTLDYPLLKDISGYTGVDAVYEFIRSVKKEQDFLKRFPREYVVEMLYGYCEEYEDMIENLCEIVMNRCTNT